MSLELGQYQRAADLAQPALDQLVSQYDVCHPLAAGLRMVLAVAESSMGEIDHGIEEHERAISCYGDDYPNYVMIGLFELGTLHLLRGDVPQALRQVGRARELMARFPDVQTFRIEIDILRSDIDLLEKRLSDARGTLEGLRGRPLGELGEGKIFAIETRLGLIAHLEHDDIRALEHLKSAEATLTSMGIPGERGLFGFTLARTLHALGRDPEQVKTHAEQAIKDYEIAGALYASRAGEVRAWLTRALRL